jgi:hypothetical protein
VSDVLLAEPSSINHCQPIARRLLQGRDIGLPEPSSLQWNEHVLSEAGQKDAVIAALVEERGRQLAAMTDAMGRFLAAARP